MRWMELAWADVGVHETAGPSATPAIVGYFRDAGHAEITSDEVAWCAAWMGAKLHAAGLPNTGSLMARSYLNFGTPIEDLRVGAVCVLRRGSDPAAGHVGFVAGWDDAHVKLLGGNQADSVNVCSFRRADILGLRWPETPKTAREVEDGGSRIAAAARQVRDDGAKGTAVQIGGQGMPVPPEPGLVDKLGGLADQASGLKGALQSIEAFTLFAWGKWPWIAGILTLYFLGRAAWNGARIRFWRTEDANTGAHQGRTTGGADAGQGT